eukprot:g43480.t1
MIVIVELESTVTLVLESFLLSKGLDRNFTCSLINLQPEELINPINCRVAESYSTETDPSVQLVYANQISQSDLDENMVSFIKGGIKVRSSFMIYKSVSLIC